MQVINTASKIMGAEQKQLCDLFHLSAENHSLSFMTKHILLILLSAPAVGSTTQGAINKEEYIHA